MTITKQRHRKNTISRLAKLPFGPWEKRDAAKLSADPGTRSRPVLKDNEFWFNDAFVNNRYSVQLSSMSSEHGAIIHLWVRRHDNKMPSSWSDLQRIKDELVGEEFVAVQVFPARADIVDQANMAHLWVLPKGFDLGFGL